MTRRKGKSVSFDAMVKFFMQQYNIPTRKDVDKMIVRLDRIERLIREYGSRSVRPTSTQRAAGDQTVITAAPTASDTVLNVIKRFKQGIGFAQIQARTTYDEKKLRNIIFRLHKLGKITRKSRGIYTAT
ncbi:MAG: hypothetical protein QNI95_15185 [Desulfobacterales bacterium]|nr:hypothetical protein [Desulfobacterales bacterium]